MSIHARRTKSGVRYDVRLRTPDGRPYKRTFRTKRQAQEFEARELADRSRGTWIDPRSADLTLADAAAMWLTGNPGKRPSALARDESIVRNHLSPTLGPVALGRIRPRDVQALVNEWSRTMAPRTVRRTYGVLRAILADAVEKDYIGRSPCRGIKLPKPTQVSRQILDADELYRLGEAIGPDHAPMVYIGVILGLRWGECAGLRVGSLDFLSATLTVSTQRTRGQGGRHVESEPKSEAGRRTLTVPRALLDMIGEHLRRRGLTGADGDAYLLVMSDGQPLDYSRWRRRIWLPAVEKAGLSGLTFHDLRRASATALVLEGVDLKTAQARLGHSDPRLTLAVYAQATDEGDRIAAERIGRRFLGSECHESAMTGDPSGLPGPA